MELLMPALDRFCSCQLLLIIFEGTNHEQLLKHNQCTWCLSTLKYRGGFFFSNKFFMEGGKLLLANL